MAIPTRSSSYSAPVEENVKELLSDLVKASFIELTNSITTMNNSLNKVTSDLNGMLIQHQYMNNDVQALKNGTYGGGQPHQYRLTRLDFPKFSGEDVRGQLYRCQQFFSIDNVVDDQKVKLVSMHVYDKAMVWHKKFIKLHEEDVPWQMYEQAIEQRFGQTFEDPMGELKNLKQNGSVQSYQEQFEVLLIQVDITEPQAISLYVGGLYKEIGLPVRMFKPRSLSDTYSLARLQESTLAASKARYTPILPTPRT